MSVSDTAVCPATFPDPFVDPGPLFDRELELVAPASEWLEDIVLSSHPELSPDQLADAPSAQSTRNHLAAFLAAAPHGHETARPVARSVSAYHFWMRIADASSQSFNLPRSVPPVPFAGMINLRLSHSLETEKYYGHIGYHVFPAHRGHHYAERSCRLLAPLAMHHGLNPLWITCNPDNIASRRTCERLGAQLVEIVDLPPDHPLRQRGETRKCRFYWGLA